MVVSTGSLGLTAAPTESGMWSHQCRAIEKQGSHIPWLLRRGHLLSASSHFQKMCQFLTNSDRCQLSKSSSNLRVGSFRATWGFLGCHVIYYIFYLPIYLFEGGYYGAQSGLGQMMSSLMRALNCCSEFGFIPLRSVIKGKEGCAVFLRPTCLLFSCPLSVELSAFLSGPAASSPFFQPVLHFGSNMMTSATLCVTVTCFVSPGPLHLNRAKSIYTQVISGKHLGVLEGLLQRERLRLHSLNHVV